MNHIWKISSQFSSEHVDLYTRIILLLEVVDGKNFTAAEIRKSKLFQIVAILLVF